MVVRRHVTIAEGRARDGGWGKMDRGDVNCFKGSHGDEELDIGTHREDNWVSNPLSFHHAFAPSCIRPSIQRHHALRINPTPDPRSPHRKTSIPDPPPFPPGSFSPSSDLST